MLMLTSNQFNPNGFWNQPIIYDGIPGPETVALFDQNGYDLTLIEQLYSIANDQPSTIHRHEHRQSIKQDWIVSDTIQAGAHLNHSLLFERKGYAEEALEQLHSYTKANPLLYKVIAMRPKWGLDFSIDYANHDGVFEILHWEWDGFDYDEVLYHKERMEIKLCSIDWNDAAKQIMHHKDQWHHLDFFEQSDWKCHYFGIVKEQFKMVIWE